MKDAWTRLLAAAQGRSFPQAVPGARSLSAATSARQRIAVEGIVHALFQRPTAGGGMELVARVSGREGTVELVWLGRKGLGGVSEGTELRASGVLTSMRGRPTLFNPEYELLSVDVA